MKDCKNAPVNSVACARPFIVSPVLCRALSFLTSVLFQTKNRQHKSGRNVRGMSYADDYSRVVRSSSIHRLLVVSNPQRGCRLDEFHTYFIKYVGKKEQFVIGKTYLVIKLITPAHTV